MSRGHVLGMLLMVAGGCGRDEKLGSSPEAGEPREDAGEPDRDAGASLLDPAVEARIDALLPRMTLAEKIAQMHGTGLSQLDGLWATADDARLGIPGFRMIDGPRGVQRAPATCFPVGIARGASFDRDLERRVGEAIALEAAAKGANVILAPVVNVLYHPAWGRAQETYGEDSYHLGEMGVAFVDGAQRHAIASAKHFAVNNIEDTRFSVDARVTERTLREVYLPHFEKLVRARVGSIMSAYNKVNGFYCGENRHLLGEILKDEWGFTGFVESDWVLGTRSAAPAVLAGLDIEMPAPLQFANLAPAVEGGELPEAAIDASVRRILRKKFEFGLDDPPAVDPGVVESEAHAALALEAAQKSIVLLKNEGATLPLSRAEVGSIAVVGTLAKLANLGDEGSSKVVPSSATSPLDGLRDAAGNASLVHIDADELDADARQAIAAAGAAIIVVGLTAADEGENIPPKGGDRETLALSDAHRALIEAVAALNPRSIVVLEGGSAILVTPWIDAVGALLHAWYPGQAGGHAIAQVIFGDVNPSGRLPLTIPASEAQLPPFDHLASEFAYPHLHGYRWVDHEGHEPAFAFGSGLSYGAVEYVSLSLDPTEVDAGGEIVATVEVRSVDREGAEIVQLYVEPPDAGVPRAPRELRGFHRLELAAGETRSVELRVPAAELRRWNDESAGWVLDPGEWRVRAGASSRDLPLTASFTIR